MPASTWARAGIHGSEPLRGLRGFADVTPLARDAIRLTPRGFDYSQELGWRESLFGGAVQMPCCAGPHPRQLWQTRLSVNHTHVLNAQLKCCPPAHWRRR